MSSVIKKIYVSGNVFCDMRGRKKNYYRIISEKKQIAEIIDNEFFELDERRENCFSLNISRDVSLSDVHDIMNIYMEFMNENKEVHHRKFYIANSDRISQSIPRISKTKKASLAVYQSRSLNDRSFCIEKIHPFLLGNYFFAEQNGRYVIINKNMRYDLSRISETKIKVLDVEPVIPVREYNNHILPSNGYIDDNIHQEINNTFIVSQYDDLKNVIVYTEELLTNISINISSSIKEPVILPKVEFSNTDDNPTLESPKVRFLFFHKDILSDEPIPLSHSVDLMNFNAEDCSYKTIKFLDMNKSDFKKTLESLKTNIFMDFDFGEMYLLKKKLELKKKKDKTRRREDGVRITVEDPPEFNVQDYANVYREHQEDNDEGLAEIGRVIADNMRNIFMEDVDEDDDIDDEIDAYYDEDAWEDEE